MNPDFVATARASSQMRDDITNEALKVAMIRMIKIGCVAFITVGIVTAVKNASDKAKND